MLKVCEAMAYAHAKGVIHRDLKPANIMVGKYGEVYVMDWGLARVAGAKDLHDVRLKEQPPSPASQSVRTERREERDDAPDSPLVTMDGDVMGTPAYMPPEQARGDIAQLGPHSDVYAVGAMLYHLLLVKHLEMPYVPKGARVSQHRVLMSVLEEAPKEIAAYDKNVPAPLVAIVEKAMQRELGRRYPDMESLAGDLRAYVEGRVVKAYETGTWAETKQWVRRNKPLTAAAAAAVLALVGGVVVSVAQAREAEKERIRASDQARIADEQRRAADAERERTAQANQSLNEKNSLLLAQAREQQLRGMIQDLARFRAQCRTLEGLDRLGKPAYRWWLDESANLLDGQAEDLATGVEWRPGWKDVQAKLAELRGTALDYTEADRARDESTHPVQARIRELESLRDEELGAIKERMEEPLRRLERKIAYSELRLGAKPWPSEADVAQANAKRLQVAVVSDLNRRARAWVDPDEVLGTPEQLVLAMLLAKRGVEVSSAYGGSEVRATYAWSLTWLGRDSEALTAIDSAIAVAGKARSAIEANRLRIQQELARWADSERPAREAELAAWRAELAAWALPADLESRIASEQAPVRARYEAQLAPLRVESKERRIWRFEDSQQEWWHAQLTALDGELSWLATMLEAAVASTETEHAKARWSEAIEGIARSPKYAGQKWPSGERLTPQVGLLPLGENPATGLWEFVHLQSGAEPKLRADGRVLRDAEGRLSLTPEMGMVFVLLPGGRVPKDESSDQRQAKWIPEVDLVPFFLSKYELTHEQWDRLSVREGVTYRKEPMMPASSISWDDISAMWSRELGWSGFPSEAQWEYGCRAGTSTQWWTGNDEKSLSVAANLRNALLPVGGLQPNAFGLHDVHGNLWEWCGDSYGSSAAPRPGVALRDEGVEFTSGRVLRGGGWSDSAVYARSAYRIVNTPGIRNRGYGLRPARGITP
jgi:formylglycine-generating enzyme required for sulfatase activity